jgi:hypothetical protein
MISCHCVGDSRYELVLRDCAVGEVPQFCLQHLVHELVGALDAQVHDQVARVLRRFQSSDLGLGRAFVEAGVEPEIEFEVRVTVRIEPRAGHHVHVRVGVEEGVKIEHGIPLCVWSIHRNGPLQPPVAKGAWFMNLFSSLAEGHSSGSSLQSCHTFCW